jgi:putative FmdB family regulatory protein
MPLYDYSCDRCGGFRQFRPMSESRAAQACPVCGTACERPLSAPFLSGCLPVDGMPRPRNAQGRVPWRAACGLGCSHSH